LRKAQYYGIDSTFLSFFIFIGIDSKKMKFLSATHYKYTAFSPSSSCGSLLTHRLFPSLWDA